ncbi:transposable element Tcb1 transposase [Trichonephila clavipes]|nr:transposable element Tcb1 transposase [Trichonephila clavipes]
MQEGTMDRHSRSHLPQCTTSREDRQLVCMAVTDRSVTSRTVAQHIERVTHLSATPRLSDSWVKTPWREDADQLHYASPHLSSTGTLPQPYLNKIMRDHTWHALSTGSSSRLNCFPGWLAVMDLSPIENMWPMVVQRLFQITPQMLHQINFGNVWKQFGLLYPKNTSKVSWNQCRGVWQWGSPTMAATLATDS